MHQDHNIPWNTLASNLKFIEDNPRVTPRATDFHPLDKPNQDKEINFFVKGLTKTVQDFAATERAKYPAQFADIGSWDEAREALARSHMVSPDDGALPGGGSIDVAEAIRGVRSYPEEPENITSLFEADQMAPLLALANRHPDKISSAHRESPGRAYVPCGWIELARHSLRAYILINIIGCFPRAREDGRFKKLKPYRLLIRDLWIGDVDTAGVRHTSFLDPNKDLRQSRYNDFDGLVDIFNDRDKLRDYLSGCFKVLYKYYMLATECGVVEQWDWIVRDSVDYMFIWKLQ
ncbi:hypothetical protein Purlil1_12179 [Purpureocillium lilacinum]|uniref:Uncharacterized protein n=1 Tax=Purpureocillium lilacinum TaxID=33203 RepID=A0ABR0BHK9_PURLI|nr:hypothetical protein Purlil1_12179 [Purpureocillium lilacinum]